MKSKKLKSILKKLKKRAEQLVLYFRSFGSETMNSIIMEHKDVKPST